MATRAAAHRRNAHAGMWRYQQWRTPCSGEPGSALIRSFDDREVHFGAGGEAPSARDRRTPRVGSKGHRSVIELGTRSRSRARTCLERRARFSGAWKSEHPCAAASELDRGSRSRHIGHGGEPARACADIASGPLYWRRWKNPDCGKGAALFRTRGRRVTFFNPGINPELRPGCGVRNAGSLTARGR